MDKNNPEIKKKALPKKPATFLSIDNSNLFGWLMSCFIVCGCMFFLGVMVGRNTAPVQFDVDRIEEKLSNLQVSVLKQKDTENTEMPAINNSGTSDIQSNSNTIDEPVPPIVYEDILDQLKDKGNPPEIYEQYVPPVLTPKYSKKPPPKHKTKPVKKNPAPEQKKQAAKSEPVVKSKPVAVLKPEIKPNIKPVPAEKTRPVVKPEITVAKENISKTEKSTQKPPELSGQGFAIQVASLKDPAQAKILMNKFKEKGYPAFCQNSEINGATWHRVRIGPYPERALANKDQNRLKAAGVDSLVISMD